MRRQIIASLLVAVMACFCFWVIQDSKAKAFKEGYDKGYDAGINSLAWYQTDKDSVRVWVRLVATPANRNKSKAWLTLYRDSTMPR